MRLYTANSPNSLKVQMALAELGLDYERTDVVLAKREQLSDEFKRINPHQKVPVLEVDGAKIAESGAIVQYLGRANAGDLWPTDLLQDALLSRWMFFESVHLAPACGSIWWSDTLSPRRGVPAFSDAVLEHAANELERPLDVLNGHLDSQEFVSDKGFTLADCALGVSVSMLKDTRLDPNERWPNVSAYGDRVRARQDWAIALGDRCLHWAD
jgi:glutathione S-transferase